MSAESSSKVSSRRASPDAKPTSCRRASPSTCNVPLYPRESSSARCRRSSKSSLPSGASRKVRNRESNAAEMARGGGSVVAPTRMIVPVSTCGKSASCCVRLKRCSSSMKRSVCSPCARRSTAAVTALRTSATPSLVAERFVGTARTAAAITAARVDLPLPGGPQSRSEGTSPRSRRRSAASPSMGSSPPAACSTRC